MKMENKDMLWLISVQATSNSAFCKCALRGFQIFENKSAAGTGAL